VESFYSANVLVAEHVEGGRKDRGARRLCTSVTVDVYGYHALPCMMNASDTDVGLPYNRSKGWQEEAVWTRIVHRGML